MTLTGIPIKRFAGRVAPIISKCSLGRAAYQASVIVRFHSAHQLLVCASDVSVVTSLPFLSVIVRVTHVLCTNVVLKYND